MQSADFEILHKASSRKSMKRREFITLLGGRFFLVTAKKAQHLCRAFAIVEL